MPGAERRIIQSACVRGWGSGSSGGGHQVHVLVLSGKNLFLNKFIKKAHRGDVCLSNRLLEWKVKDETR